ncbi:MAG TPA: hypothetical protein VK524_06285 [Polyangiaceae bacterium]|nr:hypothetical protein [Polyangiaceae bacterium]
MRRYPLKAPLWEDKDARPFHAECRPDPDEDDPGHVACTPEPYESPLAWDAVDNTIFRPFARIWAVDPGGEAVNVNAFDEVPNSTWFENRMLQAALSAGDVTRGSCKEAALSDEGAADGSWLIDQGKPHGATAGFRVTVPERGRFLFKVDAADVAQRSNAASVIGSRLYHAVGFHTPCETIVELRSRVLKLKPGLTSADNTGVERPFDRAALEKVLTKAQRSGDRVRLEASEWLSGFTLGPFHYAGVRDDDPNDVVPHEDRRELRGARLLAAWINHFDSREQNTMATWVAMPGRPKDSSPGYIKHYYLDFSDSFGSEWEWDGISRRLGHSYYLDFGHVAGDFITLGTIERPWDRARRRPPFGYFRSVDFDPETWRPGYPNPAFSRMTERDGAWMARILARFTPEHVRALVRLGRLNDPKDAEYLERVLIERHRRILRRYLGRLSPLASARVQGGELCATDVARQSGVWSSSSFAYRATLTRPGRGALSSAVRALPDGRVCMALQHDPALASKPADSEQRYMIVAVWNGKAPGPLAAHLYDLGPERGFALVALVRPEG